MIMALSRLTTTAVQAPKFCANERLGLEFELTNTVYALNPTAIAPTSVQDWINKR
jgi:hypothetical protein